MTVQLPQTLDKPWNDGDAAGQVAKRSRSAFFSRPATGIGRTATYSVAGQWIFADLLHRTARPATVRCLTSYGTASDLRCAKMIHIYRRVVKTECGGWTLTFSYLLKVLSSKNVKGDCITNCPSMAKLRKARCLRPQVEGQWPSKALPSAEDRRGDAKRPPEIGLLTATVRKPEDRCPAFAGHDDK